MATGTLGLDRLNWYELQLVGERQLEQTRNHPQ
jgi:hypothetical protein